MRLTVPGTSLTLDLGALRARAASSPLHLLTGRRSGFRLLLLFLLVCLVLVAHPSPPLPPSYAVEYRVERTLPQHDYRLPFPEGRYGRYVKFDVPKGTGFNHQLQRVFLQHHVAFSANRSLAFEPYVEADTLVPVLLNKWPWRNARIPLSAYIASVISGFERHYRAPRAVTSSFYDSVCPRSRQRVITLKTEANPNGQFTLPADGKARLHDLENMLADSVNCIRIKGEVFDDEFFDSTASVDIVDALAKSPVMAHFTFSPRVLNILNRMMPAIAPHSASYDVERIAHSRNKAIMPTNPWKHILALHLRRGDGWEAACEEKAARSAPFVSWNKLPKLPGNENVPPPADMVEDTRLGLYRAKCLPDVKAIIARARRMRKNHPLLRSIYLLTDAPDDWTEEVRRWLASDAWDKVFVGRTDVYPNFQDREVGPAVDMEVARRAGVFVGNGFSTTTANIVLLRTRDGIHPDFTQFW
ncbi:uncharacterized protein LOC62_07G009524 [Vanrija pseudolonga]|uniref:O-fucosyltransferase family protein n=1 Tax=Vanrija pseudolonga TaxID=143232 RepID=A0AAF1BUG4_9TREE|nr:hypothetical protein LOC62_07G009524 [Vanrija pseudolonga]